MTWIVSLTDESGHHVLTASVTSGELVEKLKTLARELKLYAEVREQPNARVVQP